MMMMPYRLQLLIEVKKNLALPRKVYDCLSKRYSVNNFIELSDILQVTVKEKYRSQLKLIIRSGRSRPQVEVDRKVEEGLARMDFKFKLEQLNNHLAVKELKVEDEILEIIKIYPKSLFSKMLELHLALLNENLLWAKRVADKIILTDDMEILFSKMKSFSLKDEKIIDEIMGKIFVSIATGFADPWRKKMLFTKLKLLHPESKVILEYVKNDYDWSLAELRKQSNSFYWGGGFKSYWMALYINRASGKEARDYITSNIDKGFININFAQAAWAIKKFFPQNKELRDLICRKMKKAMNSNDLKEKSYWIYLLENQQIYNYFFKWLKQKPPALFTLKRNYYKELLVSGEANLFAIYRLLELGDYSEEILWQYVI